MRRRDGTGAPVNAVAVDAWRLTQSEAEFQAAIIAEAEEQGWRCHFLPDWMYHRTMRDLRRQPRRGYRWPPAGFPDLVLCKPPTLLLVENKAQRGRLREEQRAWLAALRACGVDARVWRPQDWPAIRRLLRGEGDA